MILIGYTLEKLEFENLRYSNLICRQSTNKIVHEISDYQI